MFLDPVYRVIVQQMPQPPQVYGWARFGQWLSVNGVNLVMALIALAATWAAWAAAKASKKTITIMEDGLRREEANRRPVIGLKAVFADVNTRYHDRSLKALIKFQTMLYNAFETPLKELECSLLIFDTYNNVVCEYHQINATDTSFLGVEVPIFTNLFPLPVDSMLYFNMAISIKATDVRNRKSERQTLYYQTEILKLNFIVPLDGETSEHCDVRFCPALDEKFVSGLKLSIADYFKNHDNKTLVNHFK